MTDPKMTPDEINEAADTAAAILDVEGITDQEIALAKLVLRLVGALRAIPLYCPVCDDYEIR